MTPAPARTARLRTPRPASRPASTAMASTTCPPRDREWIKQRDILGLSCARAPAAPAGPGPCDCRDQGAAGLDSPRRTERGCCRFRTAGQPDRPARPSRPGADQAAGARRRPPSGTLTRRQQARAGAGSVRAWPIIALRPGRRSPRPGVRSYRSRPRPQALDDSRRGDRDMTSAARRRSARQLGPTLGRPIPRTSRPAAAPAGPDAPGSAGQRRNTCGVIQDR